MKMGQGILGVNGVRFDSVLKVLRTSRLLLQGQNHFSGLLSETRQTPANTAPARIQTEPPRVTVVGAPR